MRRRRSRWRGRTARGRGRHVLARPRRAARGQPGDPAHRARAAVAERAPDRSVPAHPADHRIAFRARNPGRPRGFLAIEPRRPRDVDGDRHRAGRLARAATRGAREVRCDVVADSCRSSHGEDAAGALGTDHGRPRGADPRPGEGRGGARRDPRPARSCCAGARPRRPRTGADRPSPPAGRRRPSRTGQPTDLAAPHSSAGLARAGRGSPRGPERVGARLRRRPFGSDRSSAGSAGDARRTSLVDPSPRPPPAGARGARALAGDRARSAGGGGARAGHAGGILDLRGRAAHRPADRRDRRVSTDGVDPAPAGDAARASGPLCDGGVLSGGRHRDLLGPRPLLERGLFVLEMLAAAALLGWFARSGRLDDLITASGASAPRVRKDLFKLALAGVLVALAADIVGNVSLARLVGSGILSSRYLAMVLVAGRRLAEGLVTFALRVRPLTRLRMVEHHGAWLERRAQRLLHTVSVVVWVVGTLDYFGALVPAVDLARRALDANLTIGALSLSLGDVLAFVLTVYLASVVSSLIQFVLAEDVFPRMNLRPGLPYALSNLTKYTIVSIGFILALLALGVNLNRVTVLGGALGVGVGFGLQNIVNNFVSGLILLFERPVRVGDAVQIGDVQGEVRRIGIRATTVRAWEGAEVIVPNSQLVAERVTNWTPIDYRRRLDIPVNVAYSSAPDKVLRVLIEVAQNHRDVVPSPAPVALFLGFGDSALQFQLRAWTNRLDRHPLVKSELGVAVYAALQEAGLSIPFPQHEVRIHPTALPGVQLVAFYLILATMFYLIPPETAGTIGRSP